MLKDRSMSTSKPNIELRGLETEGPTGRSVRDSDTCVLCGTEKVEVWLYIKRLVMGVYMKDAETGQERKVDEFPVFYLKELTCRECVTRDKALTKKNGCGHMPKVNTVKAEVQTTSDEFLRKDGA